MKKSTQTALTGVAIALVMAGISTSVQAKSSKSSATEKVHCYNVNKCKGHNDCKTGKNGCKGQASCHGTGFVTMPAKACTDVGGTIKQRTKIYAKRSDLTSCYGVNTCKGHNDCGGKNHNCKGHASCKGTGFVLMTKDACKDIGGKPS